MARDFRLGLHAGTDRERSGSATSTVGQSAWEDSPMKLSGHCDVDGARGRRAPRVAGGRCASAKLAGRSVKIGCLVPLTGKGAEWGQAAQGLHGDRGRGDQRQGRHRRRADRADLLRHADARSRSAQGDQPAGRARQGAGDFRPVLQRRVRDHRAAARYALEDRHQLLLLGQARPFGHEQMGVPQHAHQRQAAQAGGRGLGQGIQAEEGRHHL